MQEIITNTIETQSISLQYGMYFDYADGVKVEQGCKMKVKKVAVMHQNLDGELIVVDNFTVEINGIKYYRVLPFTINPAGLYVMTLDYPIVISDSATVWFFASTHNEKSSVKVIFEGDYFRPIVEPYVVPSAKQQQKDSTV